MELADQIRANCADLSHGRVGYRAWIVIHTSLWAAAADARVSAQTMLLLDPASHH
jgi:hypothetical protein